MHGYYGPGMAPWLVFGTIGALLAAAFGLLPLALMVAGGYFLYRWFSGKGAPMPAFATHPQGPGGSAPPAEQGIFCPACNGPVHRNWATCPHCGYRKYVAPDLIQRRCANCGTQLQKDWNACPYCSTRIDEPVTMPSPPAATSHPASPPETDTKP
jgi:DNA-directed RNA polymerase subunit RPC12/RpoP